MTDSAKDSHPLIRLARVSKAYGAQKVIDGMDLDIWPSQKVALIGPSGSGKSTLLRLLMTIEKIDGGAIEIGGVSMWTQTEGGREVPAGEAHLKTIRSRIGMVFQAFNLFPHMTVEKNITLAPVTVLGLEPKEARRRAVELLGEVGLDHKKDAYPAQLSGGEKQRVAIARALALRPEILLFDEITSALDPERVGEVLEVLRRLANRQDITMLLVTHQMHFAREVADRVVFMEHGKVVEDGRPEQIFEHPKQDRTRQFLTNVLNY
ncbi:MAG: ectoine/hydroxyectoine ABC transporter ATP-binding protein EhuA [Nitrospinaceae bacterium]|nr:MAG: ectoine/hydroxyectoine ABC transporter ATP-binding protein EhuA [Nitrospinaceae bacterium]